MFYTHFLMAPYTQAAGKIVLFNAKFVTYSDTVIYRVIGATAAAKVSKKTNCWTHTRPHSSLTPLSANQNSDAESHKNESHRVPRLIVHTQSTTTTTLQHSRLIFLQHSFVFRWVPWVAWCVPSVPFPWATHTRAPWSMMTPRPRSWQQPLPPNTQVGGMHNGMGSKWRSADSVCLFYSLHNSLTSGLTLDVTSGLIPELISCLIFYIK